MIKERIKWIDIAKCICIFFVVLAHLGDTNLALELKQFYKPFFLTVFLFVSGYTYNFKPGFLDHLKRKAKQLLIPWFMFSFANIVLSYIFTLKPGSHNDILLEINKNLLQVRGYGDGIWFVSALFVSYIPFYFFIKKYEEEKNKNNATIKFLLFGFLLFAINDVYGKLMPNSVFPWGSNNLPWHIEYVPYAMFYMFCGYIYKRVFEKSDYVKNEKLYIITFIYLVLVFVPFYFKIRFHLASICFIRY